MNTTSLHGRGFSLPELLIVMFIVALLVALTFTGVRSVIARSHSASCLSNLRSIGAAAHLFAAENNGRLPGVLWTRESEDQEEDRHPGQQWDAQLMPYLEVSTSAEPARIRTPFYCPASTLNTAAALNRQLSYAWNSRLGDAFASSRVANLQTPSTILMAIDNKMLGTEPDRNQVTFSAYGNTIYINNNQNQLRRVPYERHRGEANVLFADGSAAPRRPVSEDNPTPQRVRFYNGGPLSPGD